ncbi:hypothetical protein [Aquimarina aquimarini]|uniref:hypothetical protein n=1 Tax=Aquimarina aquimarini TaxID=1191734 RepID=UPI000D55E1F5|nr:hypothetical protein [Aquimarina aquimarini]
MKKLSLWLIVTLLSCNSPKLGEDILNFEKLDISFGIEDFYSKEFEKSEIFELQKDEILSGKKEEEFGDKLMKFWDFHTIKIDSVYRETWSYSDPGRLIGIQYNMMGWSSGDSLAHYHNMYFEKIDMMNSANGEFMALVAKNESKNRDDFDSLLNYLKQKEGEPTVVKNDFFGVYYNYSWNLNDRYISITSKLNNKKNTLKIDFEINEDSIVMDTIKKPSIDTRLFIINKKYKDSIIGKLHSGDWLFLK